MRGLGGHLRSALAALASSLLLAAPAHATFPGENGRLALRVLEGTGPHSTIQTANPDGTDFLRLTDAITPAGHAQIASGPRWSPDGRRLAFATHTFSSDTSGFVSRLEVMNADGSDRAVVLEGTGAGDWFPDGRRIFLGSRIIDVASGVSSPAQTFDHLPDGLILGGWELSPDGTKVAFDAWYQFEECDFTEGEPVECWLVDDTAHIYVVNLDGSDLTQLSAVAWDGSGASWSPDSTKLAYSRGTVSVIDADGDNQVDLGVRGTRPLWSPDGMQLLFEVRDGFGLPDWHVMDADGSNPTKVIEGDARGDASVSSWQPIPNQPPECAGVRATPLALWPPNKMMRPVVVAGATDPDGDPVTIGITGVTQDEPVGATPDAATAGGESRIRLRAERDPRGDGRVYRVVFEAADDAGGSCSGTATVSVPRHRNAAARDSAPPGYDSFGR